MRPYKPITQIQRLSVHSQSCSQLIFLLPVLFSGTSQALHHFIFQFVSLKDKDSLIITNTIVF